MFSRVSSRIICRYSRQSVLTTKHIIPLRLRVALRDYAAGSQTCIPFSLTRSYSSAKVAEEEKGTIEGPDEKHEFQAETRMLLDIVAKSLYSNKEVFLRELISNACDALEKLRFQHTSSSATGDLPSLAISINTNKQERIITIEDNGIGMAKDDLISNLGTIARSGSKEFIEQLKNKGLESQSSAVIGQFGVGFYSVFMVADKVEVITKCDNGKAYKWLSDGSTTYTLSETEKSEPGTQINIYLKVDSREFADEITVENLIKKYSNFVRYPVNLNGRQINTIEPIWVHDPKSVDPDKHSEFYRFVSNSFDKPRFTLHYKTDVPINLSALIYFPEGKPGLFSLNQSNKSGVALYARRVLIKSVAEDIIPKWLRFVRGVIDSEDIPLNLSREMLQNSPLIRKIKSVISTKVLKFLQEKSKKNKQEFLEFYKDYNFFIKEGLVSADTQSEKEEIATLLHFESSKLPAGELITISEYCSKINPDQKKIYYLTSPSRELAENSPYLEALREKNVEVLFCYESYDEAVLMHLREFNNISVMSVEHELRKESTSDSSSSSKDPLSLPESEVDALVSWLQKCLKDKVDSVKINNKLGSHPCIITVEEMASARHFIRTQSNIFSDKMMSSLLKPRLEINPRHNLIKKLKTLSSTNQELADLIADQLYTNSLVVAGLLDDPRKAVTNVNKILELALKE